MSINAVPTMPPAIDHISNSTRHLLLNNVIQQSPLSNHSEIMRHFPCQDQIPNFNRRYPEHSSESGGFHPVEIRITDAVIEYVPDFSYVDSGCDTELDIASSMLPIKTRRLTATLTLPRRKSLHY